MTAAQSDKPRVGTAPKTLQNLPSNAPSAEFAPQAGDDFVITPAIKDLTDRALAYLEIGYAVHLSGPAGTGKTTLALHIASQIGRRCTLLHGDDELRASDLIGKDSGFRRQSVRDNYVSSILKTEETVSLMWTSNRLTTACEQGHTLIYDEFTRTPATANNAFLSVLEEGILNIPSSSQEKGYVRVHPNFRAIFTSNPEEYVGVHKTQDALLDRMITIEVGHQDRETEISIVNAKSHRTREEAAVIVDIVRSMRTLLDNAGGPTIRAAIAIARIVDLRKCKIDADDQVFKATCQDVLYFNAKKQRGNSFDRHLIDRIVMEHAGRLGKAQNGAKSPANSELALGARASESSTKINSSLHMTQEQTLHDLRDEIDELAQQVTAPNAVDDTDCLTDHFSSTDNLTPEYADTTLATEESDYLSIPPFTSERRLPRPPSLESLPKFSTDAEWSLASQQL